MICRISDVWYMTPVKGSFTHLPPHPKAVVTHRLRTVGLDTLRKIMCVGRVSTEIVQPRLTKHKWLNVNACQSDWHMWVTVNWSPDWLLADVVWALFSRGLYLQVHSGKEETFTVEEGSALKGCKLGASSLGTVGRIPQCWLRQAGSPAYLRDTLALNYAE